MKNRLPKQSKMADGFLGGVLQHRQDIVK